MHPAWALLWSGCVRWHLACAESCHCHGLARVLCNLRAASSAQLPSTSSAKQRDALPGLHVGLALSAARTKSTHDLHKPQDGRSYDQLG